MTPRPPEPPMVIVQLVEILWTKATRGAPRANERAALPRAFAVPFCHELYTFQHVRMAEWEAFEPRVVQQGAAPDLPRREHSLVLRMTAGDALALGLQWRTADGQPPRHGRPQALQLLPGQWGRLILNGRHTSSAGQHYSEQVYNAAYGDPIPPDRFLSGLADAEFSLADDLF